MYDDDNYDDGFDEEALARRMRLQLWKKLFAYTKPYRRELLMLGFFATLTALMDVSFPLITRGVIDAVDAHGAAVEPVALCGGVHSVHHGVVAVGRLLHLGRWKTAHTREPRHPPRRVRKSATAVVFVLRPPAGRLVDGADDLRQRTARQHSCLGVPRHHLGRHADARHCGRNARDEREARRARAGGYTDARVGQLALPETHVAQRARSAPHQLAHHRHVQREHHGGAHEQGVRARKRKPERLQATHRQDVRRVGGEHDSGRVVRADHRDAREPRGGRYACGGRLRSAARRHQRGHAGRVHGVCAQLLRPRRTARPLVRRNADGTGIGRTHHQPDRRGTGNPRLRRRRSKQRRCNTTCPRVNRWAKTADPLVSNASN